jgi:membrane protease YdiL (CAAX protease family)
MSELALPAPAPVPAAPPPPRFGAGMSIATLALVIFAQVAFGVIVAIGAVIVSIAGHGVNDPRAMTAALNDLGPMVLLGSAVVAAAATLFAARAWAWHLVKDRTAGGIGMVAATTRQILVAVLTGVALGGAYLAVARYLLPPHIGTPLGPVMQIAAGGMAGRISFAIAALLVAPPIEELLFRGLLLKGFAASWGLAASGVVVSIVFVLLHIPEAIHYWPALIAIGGLAAATLTTRLVTGSVFAAMALHAAYNAVMVMLSFVVI